MPTHIHDPAWYVPPEDRIAKRVLWPILFATIASLIVTLVVTLRMQDNPTIGGA